MLPNGTVETVPSQVGNSNRRAVYSLSIQHRSVSNSSKSVPPHRISPDSLRRIAILGSTGSIGVSTLKIVEAYPERFSVTSLAAGKNVDAAFEQCRRWSPKMVSMADEESASKLRARVQSAGL